MDSGCKIDSEAYHWGAPGRAPQAGQLISHADLFSCFWGPGVQDQGAGRFGVTEAPSCFSVGGFSWGPHVGGGRGRSWGVFPKDTGPSGGAPLSWPCLLMPSPGDQVPARELGRRRASVPGRWLRVRKPLGVRCAPVLGSYRRSSGQPWASGGWWLTSCSLPASPRFHIFRARTSYSQLIYKISLGLQSWDVFTSNVFSEWKNRVPVRGCDIPVLQVAHVFPHPCRPDLGSWPGNAPSSSVPAGAPPLLPPKAGGPGGPSGGPASRCDESGRFCLGVLLAREQVPA